MATSSLNFSPYIPVFSRIRSATSSSLMDAINNKVVEVFDTEEELSVSLAKYTVGLSDKFDKRKRVFHCRFVRCFSRKVPQEISGTALSGFDRLVEMACLLGG